MRVNGERDAGREQLSRRGQAAEGTTALAQPTGGKIYFRELHVGNARLRVQASALEHKTRSRTDTNTVHKSRRQNVESFKMSSFWEVG